MFDDHWTKEFRLLDYVNGLIYLLAQPNHDSPLNSNCVEKDAQKFDKFAQDAAVGKQAKGHMFEYCHVTQKIADSRELEKILSELIAFFDRRKIPVEMQKKINDFYQKIQNTESESMRLFIKFIGYSETLNQLLESLKSCSGGEFENFDSAKFLEAKNKLDWYLKKCDRVFDFEFKMDNFLEEVAKRYKDKKTSRVFKNFDKAFTGCREECDKMYGHISTTTGFSKEMIQVSDNITRFIGKAKQLFDLERKIQNYEQRVRQRFGKFGSTLSLFEKHELTVLKAQANRFYVEVNLGRESEKLNEGIKFVRDVRRNAKMVLEIEHNFLSFCTQIFDEFGDKVGYKEELPSFDPFKSEIRKCLDQMHEIVIQEKPKLLEKKKVIDENFAKMRKKADVMRKKWKEEEEERKKKEGPGDENLEDDLEKKKSRIEEMLKKRSLIREMLRSRRRNNDD